ncbi:hypothetical protein YYG_04884 [Plasmodium vinckei petteri]|uniref:Uncharacterized protein n=1 Tax=Plasmodium vinckei petteri TaxID=138298 RepID=W7A9C4_PLAVN|nr:hypothetical protein YYG_04884 [Plasmodium vinckei petteri]
MAQSSYNIKDVYKEINTIDGYFGEKDGGNGGRVEYENSSIYQYCPYSSIFNSGYCRDHFQRARSGVINLLENLEKYNLEYDKLAEYAILFLSYKLKQHSQHKYKSAKLDHFYTNHIEKNEHYNKIKVNGLTCKEIIDKKKDLMNTNEISKFNDDRSKESGLRSKIIRAFKKTKRNNKKNDIESQRENQSNNNNNKDYNDDCVNYYTHVRGKMVKRTPICCGLCYRATNELYD